MQLQKENTESQLQLLKAQVHPHFLFNTLNNIYFYTQNTTAIGSKLVIGLSDMLRYILYECNQPLVPLSKEIKMLKDYCSLEQVRYDEHLDVQINVTGDKGDLLIAPLLLLPFVENCFKHGTSQMLEQPWVHLQASIVNDQLHVKLLNGKVNEETTDAPVPGIGIRNVKERLSLLYPGKHELHITSEEEVFIVNLKVELVEKKEVLIKRDKPAYA
jgi:LytS/YehU family sensor histidine kinase